MRPPCTTKQALQAAVAASAPPAPPCFDWRSLWLEFLASAVEVQANRAGAARGPLLLGADGRLSAERLDPDWTFCTDCAYSAAERAHMRAIGTCRPDWWRVHVPAIEADQRAPKTTRATQGGTRQRKAIPIKAVPA